MDSTINIRIRVTHRDNLPMDAQGIADATGRLLTEAMKADPSLLVTATVVGSVISRRDRVWLVRREDGSYFPSVPMTCPRCGKTYGWRGWRCVSYNANTIDRQCGYVITDAHREVAADAADAANQGS